MSELDSGRLDKIAAFENRMEVVQKDSPMLSQACRNVRSQLDLARTVTEAVFNDEVASDVQAVLAVQACIADELEDLKEEEEGESPFGEEE